MEDISFFKNSLKIFISIVYENKTVGKDSFDELFWLTAAKKIQYAIDQNSKLVLFMKLIFYDDKISEQNLLNLFFTTICSKKSVFDEICKNPDDWGKSLIWPFYSSSLVKVEEWADENTIKSMMISLKMENLVNCFNEITRDITYNDFPKTYKNLSRYYIKCA